ncbi:MAG: hypothetical protein LUE96_00150 [Lachnospiraceae bacterium]|nr:hypothetical protein [Lachnospiraceae bacterium]
MKKKEEARWQKALLSVLMLLISIPSAAAAAYLYGKSVRDIFMLILITAACFGTVIFSLVQSEIFGTLHYDNGGHYVRFVIIFLFSTAASCLLPTLQNEAWAVPSIALALSLFSNTVTGVLAYAGLLGVCVYLASEELLVFLLYFLMGVIFAVLFEKLDEDYKTGAPMLVAMILYVTVMIAKLVFENHGLVSDDTLAVAVINIFITFIIMLAVLRFYCAVAIDREKGKYLVINDQEYKLLAKYKEEDRQLYYNAIHTAYFAEKTARLLHMDVDVAKNGGYYHRIMAKECKTQGKTLEQICSENKFPPKAVQLLQEYNYKFLPVKMRETVAVYIADNVVSAIMYLIGRKNSGQDGADADKSAPDYGKIAVAVLHRKIDSGILNDSDISLADLGGLEKIYTGEKLYYDFLRRE